MNNEMILNRREQKINSILNATATAFNNSLRRVSSYYGQVLEREINNRQTLALLNAQIAFIMAVFPMDCSLLLRSLCGCWLVLALLKCKELL
jgi:hypothetical protein